MVFECIDVGCQLTVEKPVCRTVVKLFRIHYGLLKWRSISEHQLNYVELSLTYLVYRSEASTLANIEHQHPLHSFNLCIGVAMLSSA